MAGQVNRIDSRFLTINGIPVPVGGDGTFLSWEFPPEMTTTDSSSGDRIRNLNPARINGKLTVRTFRSELTHKVLAGIFDAQRAISSIPGTPLPGFPLADYDGVTGDSVISPSAVIEQAPGTTASNEAEAVAWVLDCASCVRGFAALVIDTPV